MPSIKYSNTYRQSFTMPQVILYSAGGSAPDCKIMYWMSPKASDANMLIFKQWTYCKLQWCQTTTQNWNNNDARSKFKLQSLRQDPSKYKSVGEWQWSIDLTQVKYPTDISNDIIQWHWDTKTATCRIERVFHLWNCTQLPQPSASINTKRNQNQSIMIYIADIDIILLL